MERQLISADDALTFKVSEELNVEHESCWHLHIVEWIQFDMCRRELKLFRRSARSSTRVLRLTMNRSPSMSS